MSKVSLELLKQQAFSVDCSVKDVESSFFNEIGETAEEAEDLKNAWDVFYSTLLDLHETLQDLLGEIEK